MARFIGSPRGQTRRQPDGKDGNIRIKRVKNQIHCLLQWRMTFSFSPLFSLRFSQYPSSAFVSSCVAFLPWAAAMEVEAKRRRRADLSRTEGILWHWWIIGLVHLEPRHSRLDLHLSPISRRLDTAKAVTAWGKPSSSRLRWCYWRIGHAEQSDSQSTDNNFEQPAWENFLTTISKLI